MVSLDRSSDQSQVKPSRILIRGKSIKELKKDVQKDMQKDMRKQKLKDVQNSASKLYNM